MHVSQLLSFKALKWSIMWICVAELWLKIHERCKTTFAMLFQLCTSQLELVLWPYCVVTSSFCWRLKFTSFSYFSVSTETLGGRLFLAKYNIYISSLLSLSLQRKKNGRPDDIYLQGARPRPTCYVPCTSIKLILADLIRTFFPSLCQTAKLNSPPKTGYKVYTSEETLLFTAENNMHE